MKRAENGRSMIEMMVVLALIGILTIGAIKAYQSGNDQNEANKIHELVSTASLNALTKMRKLCNVKESCPAEHCSDATCNPGYKRISGSCTRCCMKDYKRVGSSCERCCSSVWDVIGKDKADYKCVNSLQANSDGSVRIVFQASCDKVKKILVSQWGSSHWNNGTNTYTPPRDEE